MIDVLPNFFLGLKLFFFNTMVFSAATHSFAKEYVTHVAALQTGIAAALTDGSVQLLGFDLASAKSLSPKQDAQVAGLGINSSNVLSIGTSTGSVLIVDVRSGKMESKIETGAPLASLTARDHEVAVGSELFQHDASVMMYDLRTEKVLRKYTDSHNDDVTDVRFHPIHRNTLLSGSTDGIINIFNTDIADEDEAVYQTINHESSIHRTGFLSEKRVFALSHMETLSIYQVANPDENAEEPAPVNFGDLREKWDCQYVADFSEGHFLVGTNADSKLKLVPFSNETAGSPIHLEGAHGDEVVRGFTWHNKNAVYTGGEDGTVKLWTLDSGKRRGPQTKSSSHHKKPY